MTWHVDNLDKQYKQLKASSIDTQNKGSGKVTIKLFSSKQLQQPPRMTVAREAGSSQITDDANTQGTQHGIIKPF